MVLINFYTRYEELGYIRPVVSAWHTKNCLMGPHFQRRGPPTYWPATIHRHYPHQPSQVLWPYCSCWCAHRLQSSPQGLVWPVCQETGTTHPSDCIILCFGLLSLIWHRSGNLMSCCHIKRLETKVMHFSPSLPDGTTRDKVAVYNCRLVFLNYKTDGKYGIISLCTR